MLNIIGEEIDGIIRNFEKLRELAPTIAQAADVWIAALRAGNKIIFCGNGGSAADAQHLAGELVGRYKFNRPPLPAISLSTDTSILTAVGNDYGFEQVFARQVKALGKKGDVLVAISTSGNSPNVLLATRVARELGITTIALTGENGGKLKDEADICLNAPSSKTNNIQETHIACGHIICGLAEEALFGSTRKS